MEDKLIKIDRNGTKYYLDERCPRCGGGGGDGKWMHTGWTCWECGGSGLARKPKVYKVYTEEYEAKLAARRAAKRAKYEAEHADEIMEAQLYHQAEQERIEREKALEAARKAVSQYVGEVGEAIGYVPSSMSKLASGEAINGMPLGKLIKLMNLANCSYEWKREV